MKPFSSLGVRNGLCSDGCGLVTEDANLVHADADADEQIIRVSLLQLALEYPRYIVHEVFKVVCKGKSFSRRICDYVGMALAVNPPQQSSSGYGQLFGGTFYIAFVSRQRGEGVCFFLVAVPALYCHRA